ncbi:putative amino acid efflux protein, LysE family [Rhizobium freirei PRF 81]|uniref:Putative amino acid efflux protein, LysE family n=1 Tax=Rhizobium freirei PRF 81 TaxID=363754 RepID=N6VEB7_9HYPH|nr:putative amino acid efflux protein, LysE family [Rhizobium freirei PRF 81]
MATRSSSQPHSGPGVTAIVARALGSGFCETFFIGLVLGEVTSFLSGLPVTLGNPKAMLFHIALAPTLIDINHIGPREYAILLAATFVVRLIVLVPYMLLASRARTFLKKPRALRILNRVAASILTGTAAFIAARAA